MKIRNLILIILVCIGLFAAAKAYLDHNKIGGDTNIHLSAEEEYKKITATFFDKNTNQHIEGEITLYDGENTSKEKEKSSFVFINYGQTFYSRLGYLQTFSNGNFVVQLDTVNKYLVILKAKDSSFASFNPKRHIYRRRDKILHSLTYFSNLRNPLKELYSQGY